MDNLKPCPFCGSNNILLKGYPKKVTYRSKKMYVVVCSDCGGQTKMCYADEQKAVKAWNARTNKILIGNGENYELAVNNLKGDD